MYKDVNRLKPLRIFKKKMKTIVITQHELNQATRPNVYKNKKKYTRKAKYRNKINED